MATPAPKKQPAVDAQTSLGCQQFVEDLVAQPGPRRIVNGPAVAFTHDIMAAINVCSAANVQTCAKYVIKNLYWERPRIQILMSFLLEKGLSLRPLYAPEQAMEARWQSVHDDQAGLDKPSIGHKKRRPVRSLQRLHIVYIIDGFLKVIAHEQSEYSIYLMQEQIFPRLNSILKLAAYQDEPGIPQTNHIILQNMVTVWSNMCFAFPQHKFDELMRQRIIEGQQAASWRAIHKQIKDAENRLNIEHPFGTATDWFTPQKHSLPGNPYALEHELPAANGLFMKRVHGFPIQSRAIPSGGYDLPHGGRPASSYMKELVEHTYRDALQCFEKHTVDNEVNDIDALGNQMGHKYRSNRTHWGWKVVQVAERKNLAKSYHKAAVGYGGMQLRAPRSMPPFPPRGPRKQQRFDIAGDIARARNLAGTGGGPGSQRDPCDSYD